MAMKKFYVGVKGIIKESRGIIIIKHSEGHWDVPGGRMDGDEDFGDTLRREISEEIPGAELQFVGDFQGAFRLQKDIVDDISLVLVYFLVEAQVPEVINFSEEHVKHLWIKSLADIPEGLNPEMDRIIRRIVTLDCFYG